LPIIEFILLELFLRAKADTAIARISHLSFVCLSVDQSKTVQARNTKFLLSAAWKPWFEDL